MIKDCRQVFKSLVDLFIDGESFMLKYLLTFTFILNLVACSSKPQAIPPYVEQITTKNGSQIELWYSMQDSHIHPKAKEEKLKNLRVITRGSTAGTAIFNGVVGGILCNPLSLLSCSWKDLGFSKEQLTGTETKITNISKSYAYPKYKLLLQQKLNFAAMKDYRNIPIHFVPNENYLVYDDKGYKLVAGFNIYVDKYYTDRIFKCQKEKTGIEYDQWVENNYALAVSEGKKLVDECFERLDEDHFENIKNQIEIQKQNSL